MSKRTDMLVKLILVALVSSGPAAVAAYLIAGDPTADPMHVAAAGEGPAGPSASASGGSVESAGTSILTGMLFTRGTALVDWAGINITVEDGSYAYLGGEIISTGPGSMGVLQLDGDSRAYLCPSSRMSLTRAEGGAYQIRLYEGGGRFAFASGTDYRIEVNQGVLSPGRDESVDAQPTVLEVAAYQGHPGGVACGFSGTLEVAGYPADGGRAPIALGSAGPGEIIDLARALRDEAAVTGTPVVIKPVEMSASVRRWLRSNAPYPASPGPIGYLCRCLELKRYAEADGIPDAAIPPRMLPPDSEMPVSLAADDNPPFAPPVLPPAVLAEPGFPNPADPGVLPGPVAAPLSVPPPLVPATGSGGGYSSTPS